MIERDEEREFNHLQAQRLITSDPLPPFEPVRTQRLRTQQAVIRQSFHCYWLRMGDCEQTTSLCDPRVMAT